MHHTHQSPQPKRPIPERLKDVAMTQSQWEKSDA